jgi:hypothetical protein
MDAENLYRRIGRLIEVAPEPPRYSTLSPELMKWIGQASAIVQATGDILLQADMSLAIDALKYPDRLERFQTIMVTLYKALAAAELNAPPSAQGAFIPIGNSFDAFSAVAKILGSATKDVLLVDPYMDDTVLTDFSGSMVEGVPLRFLTDQATVKPNLAPAASRWRAQYPARPLSVRLARPRTLHDRPIFVDNAQAWTVTQSLKDLAKRSPAEIVRADDTASLKIAAYETIWLSATIVI